MDDGDSEERLGLRWSPYRDIWLGAERELDEDKTWYRLWVEGGIKAFYVWWRHSDESENNAALGYRFTEHLSLELYLDERDGGEVSVRAVGNFDLCMGRRRVVKEFDKAWKLSQVASYLGGQPGWRSRKASLGSGFSRRSHLKTYMRPLGKEIL